MRPEENAGEPFLIRIHGTYFRRRRTNTTKIIIIIYIKSRPSAVLLLMVRIYILRICNANIFRGAADEAFLFQNENLNIMKECASIIYTYSYIAFLVFNKFVLVYFP